MKKPELYQKTVDILVDAYFNDTLVHGRCTACAVGNIVAANLGYRIENVLESGRRYPKWLNRDGKKMSYPAYVDGVPKGWGAVVCSNGEDQKVNLKCYNGEAKRQIDATGYSVADIALIESSFEKAIGENEDDRMFNGLMAVIEILDMIHENTDTDITSLSKSRFQKTSSPVTL
jgi:hypothetical protein